MTHPLHDKTGQHIADVPFSENEIARLSAGETITVLWHTPIMLQGELGTQSDGGEA